MQKESGRGPDYVEECTSRSLPEFQPWHNSLIPTTPCLVFEHFCFSAFKQYDEIMHHLIGLLLLNFSAASSLPLFLPRLLCFLPLCPSRILIPAPLYTYLLAILSTIFFDHLCYCIPTFFKFFFRTLCLTHYFRYLVYRYITNYLATPHYQHSEVFAALILFRNVSIGPYLIFNW